MAIFKRNQRQEGRAPRLVMHAEKLGLSQEAKRVLRVVEENRRVLPNLYPYMKSNLEKNIERKDPEWKKVAKSGAHIIPFGLASIRLGISYMRAAKSFGFEPQVNALVGFPIAVAGRFADIASTRYALIQQRKAQARLHRSAFRDVLPKDLLAALKVPPEAHESNVFTKNSVKKSVKKKGFGRQIARALVEGAVATAATYPMGPDEVSFASASIGSGSFLVAANNLVIASQLKKRAKFMASEMQMLSALLKK